VFLAAFILILGSVFRAYASFSLFGPEDPGVEYTHEDYVSALEKTGIQVEYEGLTGEELEAYKQEEKGMEKRNQFRITILNSRDMSERNSF
jgi:hypothetical protein